MNDKKLIIEGLVIFLIILIFPLWFHFGVNKGKAAPAPVPKVLDSAKEKNNGKCIRSTEYMKAEHMQLLDYWRHSVVRNAQRVYVIDGKEFTMSLTNTCLDCHSNKAEFCDRCHDYASVRPYCWDCHIDNPKEKK